MHSRDLLDVIFSSWVPFPVDSEYMRDKGLALIFRKYLTFQKKKKEKKDAQTYAIDHKCTVLQHHIVLHSILALV